MKCNECQNWICEAADAATSALPDAAVEQHLLECAECREFQLTWVHLDEELTRGASKVAVPLDLKASVLAKLPQPQIRLLPAEIAELRVQCEQEYRAAISQLNRQFFVPNTTTVIWGLAMMTIVMVIAFSLSKSTNTWLPLLEGAFNTIAASWTGVLLCLGITLAGVIYGLQRALRPVWRSALWYPLQRRLRLT